MTINTNIIKNSKPRSSNFEVLRILCMFAIISDHIFQGSPLGGGAPFFNFLIWALPSYSRIACTVFVLIGAYFLSDCEFKFHRVVRLAATVVFYDLIITLAMHYTLGTPLKYAILTLFPLNSNHLWFVSAYIFLLLSSPFLNIIINSLSKEGLKIMLLGFAIVLFSGPTLTTVVSFWRPEIFTFFFAYFFAAYLRKYDIKFLSSAKICFPLAIAFPVLRILVLLLVSYVHVDAGIHQVVHRYLETYRCMLPTLPNFITAVGVFCLFRGIDIKYNKIINTIASTVLGVYIIHQVPVFYNYLWNGIFHMNKHFGADGQIPYAFYVIISTFFVCALIEFLRNKYISRYLENSQIIVSFSNRLDAMLMKNIKN